MADAAILGATGPTRIHLANILCRQDMAVRIVSRGAANLPRALGDPVFEEVAPAPLDVRLNVTTSAPPPRMELGVRHASIGSRNAGVHLRDVVEGSMTGATGWATGAAARAIRQSIVQDALDGMGAATALHTAA